MTDEPAVSTAHDPDLLQLVENSARRVRDLEAEAAAERERRDRHIAAAERSGCTYRAIAAAAHRGDGQATVALVRNAILRFA